MRGTDAAGPGGAASDVGPWLLFAAVWAPVAATGLVWTAGRLVTWGSGGGWSGPRFNIGFAHDLVTTGPSALGPSAPPALVGIVLLVELAPLVAVAELVWRRHRPSGAQVPVRSLAGLHDVSALAPAGVRQRARILRSSLAGRGGRHLPAAETGIELGRLNGGRAARWTLRASWEDVLLAVMAPRAGKTTALAVPTVLSAPGAVVATSNRADLYLATAALRAEHTAEPVWVFDPQSIAFSPRTWWWNPLREARTVEEAHRLASHFIQEVRGRQGKDFWTSAAHDLLTALLLAAARSGASLADVHTWLNDPSSPEPADVLARCGLAPVAASLRGRQHGAPETRDGVYETARTAAQCLRDPSIMEWVTSPPQGGDLAEFDAPAFATSRQTLYLLSRDGAGAAAPLVAALTDRIMREAVRTAERRAGRLDPPMVVVLDEAANICKIVDLPDLYSHLGSRGVVPLTILQSYRQGTRVWGELGMDALWSAATCKVIGSGIDDAKVAEDLSRLIGEHDVTTRSTSRSRGQVSTSTSVRNQRILGPDAVRALPRGTALVLATGCRAAFVHLTPWYRGPQAGAVHRAVRIAEQQLTERARPEAAAAARRQPSGGTL